MKRFCLLILCSVLMALLVFFSTATHVSAEAFPLVGTWVTSDGAALTFHEDKTFLLEWGWFPAEEGTWSASSTSGESFPISMKGSHVLETMSAVYGAADDNYHFEVLVCNRNNFYLVQVYSDYTARTSPCKLGFTREGCAADFSRSDAESSTASEGTSSPATEGPGGSDESSSPSAEEPILPETQPDSQEPVDSFEDIHLDLNQSSLTLENHWKWDLFDQDATIYDHDLALSGLAMSQMIHKPESFKSRMQAQFGFDPGDILYKDHASAFIPAFAFAHRKIVLAGQEKNLLVVVIRGTNWNNGGLSDFLTDIGSQVDGFRETTRWIDTFLSIFYNQHGCRKENTILFITGHSLGGAIAQSLAPFAENYTSSSRNCFIYTYAAANVFVDRIKTMSESYENVHNIVNERDAVPVVPVGPLFGKYGHKWFYNSADTQYLDSYEKVYGEPGWHCKNILDEHDIATYLAMMLVDLPTNMGEGAKNTFSVSSVKCPVDIEVLDHAGRAVGHTTEKKVFLVDSSNLLIATDGDEKYVYAPEGVEYTIQITGTGSGEMTVVQESVSLATGEVIEQREFQKVPINAGQRFEMSVLKNQSPEAIELMPLESKRLINNFPWWVLFLAGFVTILCVGSLVLLFRTRKRRRKSR